MAVPAVAATQQATEAAPASSASKRSGLGVDTTFINLLTAELKAQDPTAPMDGNQMVSQMVALNQLEQLIAIRQTLEQAASGFQPGNNATPAKEEI